MRKLRSLCNNLKRLDCRCYVVSHGRGDYVVFHAFGKRALTRSSFSSVRECEQFLSGLAHNGLCRFRG